MQAKFDEQELMDMLGWLGDGLFSHACINDLGDNVYQREFEILNNTWVASYNEHDSTFMVWQRVKIDDMEEDHETLTLYSKYTPVYEMTQILVSGLRPFILDRLYEAIVEARNEEDEDE